MVKGSKKRRLSRKVTGGSDDWAIVAVQGVEVLFDCAMHDSKGSVEDIFGSPDPDVGPRREAAESDAEEKESPDIDEIQNQMVVQGEGGSGPAAAMPVTDTPGGARTASEVNTGTEASQAAEQVQDSVPIDGFDDSVPIDAFSMPDSVDGLVAATQSGVNE